MTDQVRNKHKVPRSYSAAEENASSLTELGMTTFPVHTHLSCTASSRRTTFTSPIPQLCPPPPFQHSGPRQTNKRFPCNLSRRTPPYLRLSRPPCCLFCPASAKRTRH